MTHSTTLENIYKQARRGELKLNSKASATAFLSQFSFPNLQLSNVSLALGVDATVKLYSACFQFVVQF